MRMDPIAAGEADAVAERALARVVGYVDPVAHALAARAATSDDAGAIAKALRPALGDEIAREVAHAMLARLGDASSDSDSDDDSDGGRAPAWASPERGLDEAVALFDAWAAPDAAEIEREEDFRRRLEEALPYERPGRTSKRAAAPAATWIFRGDESRRRRGRDVDIPRRRASRRRYGASALLRGSRASRVALFDADVDFVVDGPVSLDAVAEAIDARPWSWRLRGNRPLVAKETSRLDVWLPRRPSRRGGPRARAHRDGRRRDVGPGVRRRARGRRAPRGGARRRRGRGPALFGTTAALRGRRPATERKRWS